MRKLLKKTGIPDQRKIEELEIEMGITPIVTETNFEREFDRAVIADYREKYGNSWIKYHRLATHTSYDYKPSKHQDKWYKLEAEARKEYDNVLILLCLEESKKAFAKEFDPYQQDNYY